LDAIPSQYNAVRGMLELIAAYHTDTWEVIENSSIPSKINNIFQNRTGNPEEIELVNYGFDIKDSVTNGAFGFYGYPNLKYINIRGCKNIKTFQEFFKDCFSLVSIPELDTSSGTDFSWMFKGCFSLVSIPELDTSSGTNFSAMFNDCISLVSIPELDTSSGTDFSAMLRNSSLISIPPLDMTLGTNFNHMFEFCGSLKRIEAYGFSEDVDISDTAMGKAAIEEFFWNLADGVSSKIVTIPTNTGADHTIAENKGWTVVED